MVFKRRELRKRNIGSLKVVCSANIIERNRSKMFNKRINIFTGHFGSGKTEVAVNYALELSRMHEKTAIVDFDIVNPYFRTADAREKLEESGIWVIVPLFANTNVDVPALPSEINALFNKKEYSVVFDVGGDDLGARAVSRYREEILENDYEMFFVVNTKRPMTDTEFKIEEMIRAIEQSSRLKVTSLVNNTNLKDETAVEDILEGHRILEQVSEKLNIPIGFISGLEGTVSKIRDKNGISILSMQKLIKLPWE